MKLRATVYPNNEVRIALYPERLPVDYFKRMSIRHAIDIQVDERNQSAPTLITLDSSPIERNRALDIKSKVDTRVRKVRDALSRYGRRQILRAGSCFKSDLETKRLLLTGTLPGSGPKLFRALAEFASYATKTLTNWLTRRVPSCLWMYCWEFQKRGALHVHLVVEMPIMQAEYVERFFKDEWNRILRAISLKSGVDLYAKTAKYSHLPESTQADVTVCDREPSRYISKYISKSAVTAKCFGRYPPKTWYQVSRSLLAELRMRTVIYEAEGLSYSQSRAIEENTRSHVAQHEISGVRRFDGSIYAWSAYFYCEAPKLSEIYKGLNMKNQCLMSTMQMANLARATMKHYAASSCFVRAATNPNTFNSMESGLITDTELLLYIEAVIKTLSQRLSSEFSPWSAAHFLKASDAWYRSKFGYSKLSPISLLEVNKIYDSCLTGSASRTKLEKQQLSLNIV